MLSRFTFLGTGNKKEYDKFCREVLKKAFPKELHAQYRKSKAQLFSDWMEAGMSWDATMLLVSRKQETKSIARKDMHAMQARDIYARLGDTMAKELIGKRTSSGLYYLDDDFPNDPMAPWQGQPFDAILGVTSQSQFALSPPGTTCRRGN